MFRRMHFGENGEEVAVERGGIGHARVAEKQGKYRGEGDPENHPSDEVGGAGPVEALHEKADEKRGVLRFAPGNDTEQAGLHREIENGDAEDGEKNAARDIFFGIADFAAEMADVVVTPVAVDGVDHGGAEPGEPNGREMKRAGRKIEGEFWIEVANAAPDEPEHGADDAEPEEDGDFADGGDFAVEENDEKNDQAAGDGFGLPER